MSNPTELPDLDRGYLKRKLATIVRDLPSYNAQEMARELVRLAKVADEIEVVKEARRAQPEGEAPQAVGEAGPMPGTSGFTMACFKAADVPVGTKLYAATLLPLCGAQHAESGKEVAAKPPFPISDDEMAALRRFWECATDGEGYDVEKSMMQRLAEMGLVQRKSGAYYMATDFGLYVLGEYTIQRAAQLDGGQEGSESNG